MSNNADAKSPDEPPCGNCVHFDQIIASGDRARHGWCVPNSVYPHVEQEGQVFPAGVRRAAPGELAQPAIRRLDQVVTACPHRRVR